jgi:hypothetical protein
MFDRGRGSARAAINRLLLFEPCFRQRGIAPFAGERTWNKEQRKEDGRGDGKPHGWTASNKLPTHVNGPAGPENG